MIIAHPSCFFQSYPVFMLAKNVCNFDEDDDEGMRKCDNDAKHLEQSIESDIQVANNLSLSHRDQNILRDSSIIHILSMRNEGRTFGISAALKSSNDFKFMGDIDIDTMIKSEVGVDFEIEKEDQNRTSDLPVSDSEVSDMLSSIHYHRFRRLCNIAKSLTNEN